MASSTQVAATTVGAGSLAAAGSYGITQAVKSSGEEESVEDVNSENIPTSEPQNPITFALTASQSSLEETYNTQLLGITRKKNLNLIVKPIETNKRWWKWAYKQKYLTRPQNTQLDSLFADLSSSFSNEDSKALNKACNAAYKSAKTNFNAQNNHLVSNIGAFCTTGSNSQDVSEPEPTTFEGSSDLATNYANKLPIVTENQKLLVKPVGGQNTNNELWWDWVYKNVFLTKVETATETFEAVQKAYANEASETTALNQVCDAAYKKTYSELRDSGWALLDDIKKFCSIDQEQDLIPAEPSVEFLASGDSYAADGLAKSHSNHSKLVDPDEKNKSWWEWNFDNNYPKKDNTVEINKLISPFDQVSQAYLNSGSNNSALNQACKTAYGKLKSEFENTPQDKTPLLDQVKRFCSTKSESSKIQAPS